MPGEFREKMLVEVLDVTCVRRFLDVLPFLRLPEGGEVLECDG